MFSIQEILKLNHVYATKQIGHYDEKKLTEIVKCFGKEKLITIKIQLCSKKLNISHHFTFSLATFDGSELKHVPMLPCYFSLQQQGIDKTPMIGYKSTVVFDY